MTPELLPKDYTVLYYYEETSPKFPPPLSLIQDRVTDALVDYASTLGGGGIEDFVSMVVDPRHTVYCAMAYRKHIRSIPPPRRSLVEDKFIFVVVLGGYKDDFDIWLKETRRRAYNFDGLVIVISKERLVS